MRRRSVLLISMLLLSQCVGKNMTSTMAIIAFTNTEQVSEDWNWFYGDIAEACKKRRVPVFHVGPHDPKLVVIEKIRIDVTQYMKSHERGYLFVRGDAVKYQPYEMSSDVLRNASEFLGIDLGRKF